MRIRAAVLRTSPVSKPYGETRPLSIETVELAPPQAGEVLIKIAAAGLCHSDLSVINGDRPRQLPMVLGHEASGVVVEPGPGVTDLAPGDHVVMSFVPTCGTCPSCLDGRAQMCGPGQAANGAGTLLGGGRRLTCDDGTDAYHLCGISGFGEYAVISRRSIIKIDPEMSLVDAALFGCAVMTGVGAIVNTCGVRPGQSVAVVGLGGVGLSAVMGAVAAGAEQIVALDLSPAKLDIARSLGATDTFLANDPDVVDAVKAATKGGVDHAVEMAGSAPAFELAYKITRRGGTTTTGGLANPNARVSLPPVHLVAEERTIKGSYMGSCVPPRDIPRFMALYRRGKLPVNRLLSSTGPLDEINEGFDRLDRGEVVRHVIVY
ncbi:zinc-dependent alcohol dehydrogenase family protein [Xanthobacter autotrophicus]|uniref:zinc-dependent alcohol dehydrogenase family protein n=1 Tax=Xanthobacter autotrophicus TaxID=280 RepID=UPI0024A6E969|nr:zinc-dependent alcohol dehydrogenase family protein [Xanthobacter autotrophicus]MDI4656962.1 zinc-dependent alcohol dehydrogenase family protein [Xanthobacter autotrophicus]